MAAKQHFVTRCFTISITVSEVGEQWLECKPNALLLNNISKHKLNTLSPG